VSGHTLLLDLEAVEHHVLRPRIAEVVPNLDRESRPFGNGATGTVHKVLTKVVWRDMRQGAEPHGHSYDSARPLLPHNGCYLAQQIGNQGRFMHSGLTSLRLLDLPAADHVKCCGQ
jgi:hypothetical protein